MKSIIICFLLIASSALSAVSGPMYSMGKYQPHSEIMIFGDNVRVRTSPEIKENIALTLPAGFQVTVLEDSGIPYTSSGYTENWYKISYTTAGKTSTGYVWGGLLAKATGRDNNFSYAAGITGQSEKDGCYGEIRLLSQKGIVSSLKIRFYNTSFTDTQIYSYSVDAHVYGNRGIKGIDSIFELKMDYPACGYEYGSQFFARKGENLIFIANTSSMSEAGVFSYSEEILFPEDADGVAGKITIKSFSKEYDDEIEDYKTAIIKKKYISYKNGGFSEEK